MEVGQVVKKVWLVEAQRLEVGQVGGGKVQVLELIDDLGQPGGDHEAAVVGNGPEKDVKDRPAIIGQGGQVTVGHRKFVEVG